MASPRRRKKPMRQARARSTSLAAAPGPALRQAPTPAAGTDAFELMGNMAARCAELPLRLLRARSPLEVWQEQMLFIQSVTNAYRLAARMSVPAALATKTPAKASKTRTRPRKA